MSVTQTLRAVEILRSLGVTVTFEPGWEIRGNGQSSAYQGGIIHHTGGSYANSCPGILIHGRSDLAGPLCNFAGLANGVIHVVAAHPGNHAGASGGPSNGPFPVTGLFNKLVMGLEICYPGGEPMRDAQYRSAKAFAKTMQIMYGSIERARAHRETSREGKWDPGYAPGQTINMAALRSEAANFQEGDMQPTDRIKLVAPDAPDYSETHPLDWALAAAFFRGSDAYNNVARLMDELKSVKDDLESLRAKVESGAGGTYPGDDHVRGIAVDAVRDDLND